MCPYMCIHVYLYTLFALFSRFGQSMVDTLCLHNNTSNWAPNSNLANLVIYGVFLKNQHFAT